jgi:hypothetical protein
MYFSVQSFSPSNPRPYDDTGWTFPLMRNVVIRPVSDKAILDQPATMLTADAKAPGGIDGSGSAIVVDHTTDNNLVTFRFKHADVKMRAAQEDFEAGGRKFRAGAFVIDGADRAKVEPTLRDLGLSGFAVASAPSVAMHELDVPRIGYVHSWQRTQDEGWVRAAFDTFGVPYSYFSDITLRDGNLRAKYDVIVFPHVGGTAQSQVAGLARTGKLPLPYKKSAETPNLGGIDEADDIRGGMGWEGLMELVRFVQQGGTLIVEGSTATIFPEYNVTTGITVEQPEDLFARGSVMRGVVADRRSPIAYGYDAQVPVYFNQAPVMNAGGGGGGFGGGRGGGGIPGVGMNITPMAGASQNRLSTWDWDNPAASGGGRGPQPGRGGEADEQFGGRGGRGGFGGFGGVDPATRPRVVLQFPSNPDDMLLSGVLVGGQLLANRAQVVDAPVGQGHVVMFAIRPYWRWQTQGTYFLGFNTILHWNDLNAGRGGARGRATSQPQ